MVRLTQYAAKGGCACKIGPHILSEVLRHVQFPTNERVLVDSSGMDDAGIYAVNDTLGLVQTLDFFTPVVDDAFTFGQIAAANSISDVYAMGGRPITAMNIVGFPVPLVEKGILADVLRGASAVLAEAGVAVVGGHSIENEVPLFGMSVTGLINPEQVWTNRGAQVGDVLILTKPIGTGIMSTALKGDLFLEGAKEAVASMVSTNRIATEVASKFTVHSCTDITGFSLLGHASEMARGSEVSIEIDHKRIPLFKDVQEAAQMGLVPAATYGNRKAITDTALQDELSSVWSDICFDPQTSGGLLLAVPSEEGATLVKALHESGIVRAAEIGIVQAKSDILVKLI